MQDIMSVNNMRYSDAWTCANIVSSRELMKRAGEAVFEAVEWKAPVAIVCGSGNNGGDGYIIAHLLNKNGIDCQLFRMKENFSSDGAFFYELCRTDGIKEELCTKETDFSSFRMIVDCMFGTGLNRDISGLPSTIIEAINDSRATIISVDINSGLNGDTGLGKIIVHSDLTVSLGGWKPGHFLGMAKDVIKKKINCDIGIMPQRRVYHLVEREDVSKFLGKRKNFSNKGDYGYLALIGGSVRYSGAIRLANIANSAMRAGAGVVKLAVPKSICLGIMPHILESTLFPLSEENGYIRFHEEEIQELLRGVKTIAFGMGIGNGEEQERCLKYLFQHFFGSLIVDADGLSCIARINDFCLRSCKCRLILTPHLKEFSRLCGKTIEEINESPVELAELYARENRIILLLKGPTTIITDGSETYFSTTGCPGMATAGSGDVLSGIVAALCASHPGQILEATAAAAYINGYAGELAQEKNGAVSMIASDTVANIQQVIKDLDLIEEH